MASVLEAVAAGQKCIVYTATKAQAANIFCYLRAKLREDHLSPNDASRKCRLHMGEGMTRVRGLLVLYAQELCFYSSIV